MVLLGPGVVHDVTTALSGMWTPDQEPDEERRAAIVAAARLRLYGTASDRSGWHVVTTASASLHAAAIEANDIEAPEPSSVGADDRADGNVDAGRTSGEDVETPSLGTEWSAGFFPALESFDDAPPAADVATLADLLHGEGGLEVDDARTLALALLCEPVTLLVTRWPEVFAHQRHADLPARLEILDAPAAVARLDLLPGEPAWIDPPAGSALAAMEPWWVPAGD